MRFQNNQHKYLNLKKQKLDHLNSAQQWSIGGGISFSWDGKSNGGVDEYPIKLINNDNRCIHANENDNTLIVKVLFGNISVLLTGDATHQETYDESSDHKEGFNATILQASYHGVDTDNSTSSDFQQMG